MVRNINPSAPLIVLLVCSENFNLMSNQTPRSRIVSVFSGTEFWTVYLATTGFCFRVMLNYLHLARSSFNFQVSDQSARYLCEIHLHELRIQLRANFVIWFYIFSKKGNFSLFYSKSHWLTRRTETVRRLILPASKSVHEPNRNTFHWLSCVVYDFPNVTKVNQESNGNLWIRSFCLIRWIAAE